MIKIAVPGASGRMGSLITDLVSQAADLQLVAGADSCDVLIDFTSPEGTLEFVSRCLRDNIAMVIGTTGLSEEQFSVIKRASQQIPILYSANMSFGVNVCYKLLGAAANMLDQEWQSTIHDVHHKQKKDSPSGTAKQMANIIAENSSKELDEIKILSERRDEFVGTHSVTFSNPLEDIIITHQAKDRSIFAAGAITAARWLYKRSPGMYSIQDII